MPWGNGLCKVVDTSGARSHKIEWGGGGQEKATERGTRVCEWGKPTENQDTKVFENEKDMGICGCA